MSPASSATRPGPRAILAGNTGNVLEWYDFLVFAFLAPDIGERFSVGRRAVGADQDLARIGRKPTATVAACYGLGRFRWTASGWVESAPM